MSFQTESYNGLHTLGQRLRQLFSSFDTEQRAKNGAHISVVEQG